MTSTVNPARRPPLRIVVAEDEATMQEALCKLLEEAGYVVVGVATDGVTAVRIVEELRPDVLLVDFRMPEMTGIEVATALRDRACEVGVIMLSAFDDASLQLTAERIPVSAYLVKGCSSKAIFDAIDQVGDCTS